MTQSTYDIIIAGGGPAGLSLASALAGSGFNILVVEKQDEASLENAAYDGREIALTHHSRQLMERFGMWSRMDAACISLIRDAKVLNGHSPFALHFDHRRSGKDNLGFMVSNHLIRRAAYAAAKAADNVSFLTGVTITDAKTDDAQASVTLSDGQVLTAQLLVVADSRFSTLRDKLGVAAEKLDFKRTCIVSRVDHEQPNQQIAYECFYYDRTLAVLPLNNNQASIVVTIDTSDKGKVLDVSEEEFCAGVAAQIDNRYGSMKLVSDRHAYPLVSVFAKQFAGKRFVLLGDACVGMHPVTAHGFNFGLEGAATLADELLAARKVGLPLGAAQPLQNYARKHRRATRGLYMATNALVQLFTRTSAPAKLLRHALLAVGNHLPPAKKLIMNQLTGTR